MDYKVLLQKAKTGDLFSFSGTDFFSRLIRLTTLSDSSHVGLAIWLRIGKQTADQLCILHSEGHGVNIHPISLFIQSYLMKNNLLGNKLYWHPLREGIDGEELVGHALHNWGKSYPSNWRLLEFLMPGWYKKIRRRLGISPEEDNKYQCSEFIGRALVDAKLLASSVSELEKLSPRDITNLDLFEYRAQVTLEL